MHELIEEGVAGYFVHANPAVCKMLGYSLVEMRILTPLDIQDETGLKDVPLEAERLAAEEGLRFEKVLVRKDGTKSRRRSIQGSSTTTVDGWSCRVSGTSPSADRLKMPCGRAKRSSGAISN